MSARICSTGVFWASPVCRAEKVGPAGLWESNHNHSELSHPQAGLPLSVHPRGPTSSRDLLTPRDPPTSRGPPNPGETCPLQGICLPQETHSRDHLSRVMHPFQGPPNLGDLPTCGDLPLPHLHRNTLRAGEKPVLRVKTPLLPSRAFQGPGVQVWSIPSSGARTRGAARTPGAATMQDAARQASKLPAQHPPPSRPPRSPTPRQ